MHDQYQAELFEAHRRCRDSLATSASRLELDFQLSRDLLAWIAHQGQDAVDQAVGLVESRTRSIRDAAG